ncbi:MAG: thymidylate synthase [Agitococcus sp.]|nr:thymidylate synthase [Agitococcus sp.]
MQEAITATSPANNQTFATPTPHPMQQFHEMLSKIRAENRRRPNRTGVDTVFIPGHTLKFDMADGFPAITSKKLAFKTLVAELVGFFRGFDNAVSFRELGCKIWDGNANETTAWLNNPARKGTDDLGRCYPKQWTDWRDTRCVPTKAEADALVDKGYTLIAEDLQRNAWVVEKGINQLENALRAIMTNPNDRQILISAWRPDEHDRCALASCHVVYQFIVDTNTNTLHLCLFQRSFDTFLAFNIATAALFLEIMAKLSGTTAGTFTHFIGDAHIYLNHFDQVDTLLSREHYPQPTLVFGDSIPTLTSISDIPGVFERIEPQDIVLTNYISHAAIPAPMAT